MQQAFSDMPVRINFMLASSQNDVAPKATLGLPVNEASFQILERIFMKLGRQDSPKACLMVECPEGLMPVNEVVLTNSGLFFYEPANETGHRRVTIKVAGQVVNIRIETEPEEGVFWPIEFADRRQQASVAAVS